MNTIMGSKTCVSVERAVLGMLANNVYVLSAGHHMVLVDPSCEAEKIMAVLNGRVPDAIFVTHAHFDHIGALAKLRELTGAPVYASEAEAPQIQGEQPLFAIRRRTESCPVDVVLQDGETVSVGPMTWKVMVCPGHSPGSTCFYIDAAHVEGAAEGCVPLLVAGDTLFAGTIGRTDFEGGSMAAMCESLARLAVLPDETLVLPGHNELTTIAAERERVFARYQI